jgi:hypothetical protein
MQTPVGTAEAQRCLSRLPDVPRWVETRSLLTRKDAVVLESTSNDGFVVWSRNKGIGSVVGKPCRDALARATDDVTELLAFPENIREVREMVDGFRAEPATVFSAPPQLPAIPAHQCGPLGQDDTASIQHLPPALLDELCDVLEDGAVVIAALADTLPVAFAYAAFETGSLWDVSIDTVESHRRMGYATAAVVHLMEVMEAQGKAAVWGAPESNQASANLARRLDFRENDTIWVLART